MKLFWQQIPSTVITEILCSNRLDGVVLDNEHGCFNNTDLCQSIQIATLSNKKVFVRITNIDEQLIRMVLDHGATGIILSTTEDVNDFIRLKSLCKYPPLGVRGQGLVRENFWGEKDLKTQRTPMVIPQIETINGVIEAKKIYEHCEGPMLVGPYDLSASCGDVGNFKNPYFINHLNTLKIIAGKKLGYHIVKDIEGQLEDLKDSNFLAFGLDTLFLIDGVKSVDKIAGSAFL
jgi:2-keto-3-deoxy-L-rhamnonate aldolase RhmA